MTDTFDGYATKVKFRTNEDGETNALSFALRKDPFSHDEKEKYMTFWINGEKEKQIYEKHLSILNEMPQSNDDIKSNAAYRITVVYYTKGKYDNITDFTLRKNEPSGVDKAFGEDHTVKAPEIKARQEEHPEQADMETAGVDITHKMGVKDIQIARGNVLNASVNFVGTVEERVKYCKRLMQFIESGD